MTPGVPNIPTIIIDQNALEIQNKPHNKYYLSKSVTTDSSGQRTIRISAHEKGICTWIKSHWNREAYTLREIARELRPYLANVNETAKKAIDTHIDAFNTFHKPDGKYIRPLTKTTEVAKAALAQPGKSDLVSTISPAQKDEGYTIPEARQPGTNETASLDRGFIPESAPDILVQRHATKPLEAPIAGLSPGALSVTKEGKHVLLQQSPASSVQTCIAMFALDSKKEPNYESIKSPTATDIKNKDAQTLVEQTGFFPIYHTLALADDARDLEIFNRIRRDGPSIVMINHPKLGLQAIIVDRIEGASAKIRVPYTGQALTIDRKTLVHWMTGDMLQMVVKKSALRQRLKGGREVDFDLVKELQIGQEGQRAFDMAQLTSIHAQAKPDRGIGPGDTSQLNLMRHKQFVELKECIKQGKEIYPNALINAFGLYFSERCFLQSHLIPPIQGVLCDAFGKALFECLHDDAVMNDNPLKTLKEKMNAYVQEMRKQDEKLKSDELSIKQAFDQMEQPEDKFFTGQSIENLIERVLTGYGAVLEPFFARLKTAKSPQ